MRFLLPMLFFFTLPLWPQQAVNTGAMTAEEQLSLVGIKLEEVIARFGTPKAVFAARGKETWQDDVVFQYAEGDFYIFKDRVWQVKLSSARGISIGDPKAAVLLVLGSAVEDKGEHLLLSLPAKGWPLMFRVNLNSALKVDAIYIYRPD